MSTSKKQSKVVEMNGALGHLKGEQFYSESNFQITRVVCSVRAAGEKGFLVKIKGTNEETER